MDRIFKQYLKILTLPIVCFLPIGGAYATAYTFPNPPGNATIPQELLSALDLNSDTLTVLSGTMQTTNSTAFTVDYSNSTIANPITITVNSGATLSYAGTNSLGKVINGTLNTASNVSTTIENDGTIGGGTAQFSVFVTNSQANSATLVINNRSTMIGAIFTNNLDSATVNFDGNATLSGGINMSGGTQRLLNIGQTTTCNFTTQGTYDGISLLIVLATGSGSTFTQNDAFAEITALTINAGATYNLNSTLGGLSAADGAITNTGTFNIAGNITKSGPFTTAGTTGNTRATHTVSVATSSYVNSGTHTAQMYDLNNIGNMTLTASATTTLTDFALSYTGGYLNSDTYTLFTSPVDITWATTNFTKPANTLFLSFGDPTRTANLRSIQTTITRTPFNNFATTDFAENIGISLEAMGDSTPSADMLQVLNAVEACTTADCVQSSLLQLGPLVTAPLYAYAIENVNFRQIELRLASLRSGYYVAGDGEYDDFIMGNLLRENYFWLRPYGAYANQQPQDDITGYYATTGGLALGFDRNLDARYNLGLGLAYSLSHVRDKINSNSETEVKSYQGMLYGTYNFTNSRYLDWIASIMANNFTGARYIQINNFNATANSKYSSQNFSVKGVWGQDFAAFDFLQATPEASVLYTFSKQYSYQENSAGGANLVVDRVNANTVQLGIGGKLSVPFAAMPSVVVPEINGMVLYNLVNGKQNNVFNFVDGPSQVISHMTPERTTVRVGASLTVAVFDSLQVKAAANLESQNNFSSYWVYLNIKYLL